jgi:hypothetical protein
MKEQTMSPHDMRKPDFAGDLRELVARAIYARRPDCHQKLWPVETDEQRRSYPHNPIAAVDLSYDYADAALKVITERHVLMAPLEGCEP